MFLAAACMPGHSDRWPSHCCQVLVVRAAALSSRTGSLTLCEKWGPLGAWRQTGGPISVSFGRGGLAFAEDDKTPRKQEGDARTPLGTFPICYAFGRGTAYSGRLAYVMIRPTTVAVDDPASAYYNRMVDRNLISFPDWHSAEAMFRPDPLYDLGIVVGYNMFPVVPGRGSCIFLHIWRGRGIPTSGCIAMAKEDLERVVRWLDPAKNPVIQIVVDPTSGAVPGG